MCECGGQTSLTLLIVCVDDPAVSGRLSIFDFMAMMQFTALMDELVTERDVRVDHRVATGHSQSLPGFPCVVCDVQVKFAFVNALMFEVDEMNSGGRHMLMSQVEFYEAVGLACLLVHNRTR